MVERDGASLRWHSQGEERQLLQDFPQCKSYLRSDMGIELASGSSTSMVAAYGGHFLRHMECFVQGQGREFCVRLFAA